MLKTFCRILVMTSLVYTSMTEPAAALGTYVYDQANLLSPATVAGLNTTIENFQQRTGKEIVVDIVPSTNGQSAPAFAQNEFMLHSVNGVMIFVAKNPKTVGVIGDTASRHIFPPGSFAEIRNSIRASFREQKYDEGITNGVGLITTIYDSHINDRRALQTYPQQQRYATEHYATVPPREDRGGNWFFPLLIGLVVILVIMSILRASRRSGGTYIGGPMNYGGGYGQPPYGGGPYGGPYGGGGGWGGGGGGGFFSGLLGGLGGAFLGNELFQSMNRPPEQTFVNNDPGVAGSFGNDMGPGAAGGFDSGAFQNDPGQADMGNASFGDWGGDTGGGDAGGNGGDGGW